MKTLALAVAALLACDAGQVCAAAAIGAAAPDFTAVDSNGQADSLAAHRGQVVVLEWNNPDCPFVRKHSGAGNLQKQQAAATAAGVVWLTVNSSADGRQGRVDGAAANAFVARVGGKASAYLLDADGRIGRAYGAMTTPHLFVIDATGTLRYAGGIDSIASTDPSDIPKATQYLPRALAEIAAGKPVSVPTAEPCGCSVKYAD